LASVIVTIAGPQLEEPQAAGAFTLLVLPIPLIPLSPQADNSSAPQAASPAREPRNVFDPSMVVISEREVSRAANGKPQKGLTPSKKASLHGDKTPSGTTTCAMLEISLIQARRVLGSCDREKLTPP
jgi:hypothetical protein